MPVGRMPTEAEMEKIHRHAPDAKPENVLVYRHLMVGDQIVPRRFMRLHPIETLPKFQTDTAAGAPWIFDHNYWNPVTFGRAFEAELVKEPENCMVERDGKLVQATVDATHLYGMYYMPTDVELPAAAPYPSTTKMAQAIDMGLSRDTSIGFGIDRYECSICHNDIRDWDNCMHMPGQVYDVGENKKQMCIVDCKGGQLIEQSSVFRGAYPIAGIQRQDAASASTPMELVPDAELKAIPLGALVFHTYDVMNGLQTFVPAGTARRNIEGLSTAGAGAAGKEQQAAASTQDPVDPPAPALAPDAAEVERLKAELASAQTERQAAVDRATAAEDRVTLAEQALSGAQERIRTALALTPEQDPVAFVESMARDLQDTVTYRQHLVDETVAMGVRAHGNAFPAEQWQAFLSDPKRTLAELQQQAKAFEGEAFKRLPASRLSVPADPPGEDPEPDNRDSHTYRVWRKPGN